MYNTCYTLYFMADSQAARPLITPERIARLSVPDAITALQQIFDAATAVPTPKKKPTTRNNAPEPLLSAFKPPSGVGGRVPIAEIYYQQDITLLQGIADIEPYHVHLPDAPPFHTITNYGKPLAEQVFQRELMPPALAEICRNVRTGRWPGAERLTQLQIRQAAIETIEANPELSLYVQSLWLKRLRGDWQIINGQVLHIPPTYWFYLNFWEMNIGLPDFRYDTYHYCTDLWFFTFWDYLVVPNPYCDGAIEFAMRQTGKSYRLGVLMYEQPSRTYEANAGMQSKSDADGALLFEKAVVKPWRKLPFFFQPTYSNSTYPKKALEFTPPANKGKKGIIESLDNDELMGWIDFATSALDGYDGPSLDRYGDDECGKTIEVDVYERFKTMRPAMRTRGGKSYHTTTVEELTKRGGKFFKKMFNESDRATTPRPGQTEIMVDENGETRSGLWPWFVPAYCNYSFDQYGCAIVDTITKEQQDYVKSIAAKRHIKYWYLPGKEAIDKMILAAGKDQAARQDVIRKHPRSIAEAFEASITHCRFKLEIINKRLEYFRYSNIPPQLQPFMRMGRFEWKPGCSLELPFGRHGDGGVEFVETDEANARIYKIDLPGEAGYCNRYNLLPGGKYGPANAAMFFGSSDTFKYNTRDVKNPSDMSMGAAHVYAAYNPLIDDGVEDELLKLTDDFVGEYFYRPDTVDEFCEDMVMMAIYWGCKFYPENNLDNVHQFFKKWGFEHFLQMGRSVVFKEGGVVYKDELRSGSNTNMKTIETMFRLGAQYIVKNGHRCKFPRTLRQYKEVDDDLNPFDLFVSSTVCLISAFDINTNPTRRQVQQAVESPGFNLNCLRIIVTGRN